MEDQFKQLLEMHHYLRNRGQLIIGMSLNDSSGMSRIGAYSEDNDYDLAFGNTISEAIENAITKYKTEVMAKLKVNEERINQEIQGLNDLKARLGV